MAVKIEKVRRTYAARNIQRHCVQNVIAMRGRTTGAVCVDAMVRVVVMVHGPVVKVRCTYRELSKGLIDDVMTPEDTPYSAI